MNVSQLIRQRPWIGVHKRKSLMCSSLLLQQCSSCPAFHSWMVCVMAGKWPHTSLFVWCCFKDVFKTIGSMLVLILSRCFGIVQVMQSYNSTDTATAWKKKIFLKKICLEHWFGFWAMFYFDISKSLMPPTCNI